MWGFLLFQSSVKSPFDPFIKGEKLNYIKMILFPNTIQFLLTYGLSKLWETKKNLLKLSSKRLIIQLIHIKQYIVYLLATQRPSVYSSEGGGDHTGFSIWKDPWRWGLRRTPTLAGHHIQSLDTREWRHRGKTHLFLSGSSWQDKGVKTADVWQTSYSAVWKPDWDI